MLNRSPSNCVILFFSPHSRHYVPNILALGTIPKAETLIVMCIDRLTSMHQPFQFSSYEQNYQKKISNILC